MQFYIQLQDDDKMYGFCVFPCKKHKIRFLRESWAFYCSYTCDSLVSKIYNGELDFYCRYTCDVIALLARWIFWYSGLCIWVTPSLSTPLTGLICGAYLRGMGRSQLIIPNWLTIILFNDHSHWLEFKKIQSFMSYKSRAKIRCMAIWEEWIAQAAVLLDSALDAWLVSSRDKEG